MTDIYMLTTLEQVKAIADPLRIRILHLLSQQALTTKQVADALQQAPHKLYHHVETLENAQLIRMVETRPNRGTLEKYYKASAKHFTLSPVLFEVSLTEEPNSYTENTLSSALQATLTEVKDSLAKDLIHKGDQFFSRFHIQTSLAQAEELKQKLQQWIDDCRAAHQPDGDQAYGSTVVFYPTAPHASENTNPAEAGTPAK